MENLTFKNKPDSDVIYIFTTNGAVKPILKNDEVYLAIKKLNEYETNLICAELKKQNSIIFVKGKIND